MQPDAQNPFSASPLPPQNPEPRSQTMLKKYWWVGALAVLLIIGGIIAAVLLANGSDPKKSATQELQTAQGIKANVTDPVQKGKYLSGGACEGKGSKKLGSAPMNPSDLSVIIPYGSTAGKYVTPSDRQHYWGSIQFGSSDAYEVLAPADGKIVGIQYRDRSQENGKIKGDYSVTISYSCTFFSYFDLATSLSADVQEQLPSGWEQSKGKLITDISVKQGQVIGRVGGQPLDFAVWDTTKRLGNLVVPEAYDIAEPWKIVTAPPLDYFADSVKKEITPYYARKAAPLDGVIDQDITGKLAGNWFREGTFGYAGAAKFTGGDYYKGHIAFAHDHIDPTSFIFSTGSWVGSAQQFAITSPTVTPDNATVSNNIVKYDLAQIAYMDGNTPWRSENPGTDIKLKPGAAKGVVLVQMLDTNKIRVEVFPGKTSTQVQDFTPGAQIYTRGEDAKSVF